MKWTGEEDSPNVHGEIQAYKADMAMTGYGWPSFGMVSTSKTSMDSGTLLWDGFAKTSTAVLVVALCLGGVPLGCDWQGGREAFVRGCGKEKL